MELKITSPDKIIYPKQKITKLQVANYYLDISELMLPYLKNRPLAVVRCHGNIENECFFKKHLTNEAFDVKLFKNEENEYFYLTTQKEIVQQVQMGTLEFHVWGSNVKNIEKPDIMVFDLDPDEGLSLKKLRDSVLKVKSVLDELGLKSFLKTSGGKGYHIVLPFKYVWSWKRFYDFSKMVALLIEGRWPEVFTTNIKKNQRKGKVFIDYMRNNRGSTCVCAYSLRAKSGASVSMPISWEDLNNIKPNQVTIKNYKDYVNDSWVDFDKVRQTIV